MPRYRMTVTQHRVAVYEVDAPGEYSARRSVVERRQGECIEVLRDEWICAGLEMIAPSKAEEEAMENWKANPKIAAALTARRELIRQLEEISPNIQILDDKPNLEGRLADLFNEIAHQARAAAKALTGKHEP